MRNDVLWLGLAAVALPSLSSAQGGSGPPVQAQYTFDVSAAATDMSMASIADLDGDGYRDLIVGLPSANLVEVRSGVDGTLIYTIPYPYTPPTGSPLFGFSVASLPDITGDNLQEVIVGAPRDLVSPGIVGGRVFVFAGSSSAPAGQQLPWATAQASAGVVDAWFGWSVAAVQLNASRKPEIVVGARYWDPLGLQGGDGRIEVFTPKNGALLPMTFVNGFNGTTNSLLGDQIAVMSDYDADGILDVAISATGANAVFVYSGASLGSAGPPTVLGTFLTYGDLEFGRTIANLGDLDGDGTAEIGFCAASSSAIGLGSTVTTSATADIVYPGPAGSLACPRVVGIAGIGDADLDGFPEIVLGGQQQGSCSAAGEVYMMTPLVDCTPGSPPPDPCGFFGSCACNSLTVLSPAWATSSYGEKVITISAAAQSYAIADPGLGRVHVFLHPIY